MPYSVDQLRTRMRHVLNEATASFWSDTQLNNYIGDAAVDISSVAKCVEATQPIDLNEGDRSYALPADCLEVIHVQQEETGRGLVKITPSSAGHHSAATTDGEALRWFEWNKNLYIEPIPNTALGTKQVLVFYARVTQDITQLPEDCQLLAIDYGLYRAKQQDRHYAEAASIYSAYLNSLILRRNTIYIREPQTVADLRIAEDASSG